MHPPHCTKSKDKTHVDAGRFPQGICQPFECKLVKSMPDGSMVECRFVLREPRRALPHFSLSLARLALAFRE